MNAYESIITGLNEAIEDAKSSKKELKRNIVTIDPVKQYDSIQIKNIRKKTGFTQKVFAACMGVSEKTVEAWESGTNHPSGSSCRILSLIESDSDVITNFPFVRQSVVNNRTFVR